MEVDKVLENEEGNVSTDDDEISSDEGESMGAFASEHELVSDHSDLYQLNVSVAVTEEQNDEIEGEFSDALTEICGEKSFPCSMYDKVCKSKGGLT